MIVKRNKVNSNFQTAYFIAGSCFTPDAAWFALLNQRDDRQRALDSNRAQQLRTQARRIEAERNLGSEDPAIRLRAQADIMELDSSEAMDAQLFQACEDEIAFIDQCLARLEPLRRYRDLPELEAVEACQREEFAREFQFRIENFLMSQGQIPHNELAVMRQHPDFATQLLPHIHTVTQALTHADGVQRLLPTLTKPMDLPALLGYRDADGTDL